MSIPIIDIFAGPGGLGEGFSSLTGRGNSRKFKIALSIEKDIYAHSTLELRSFFRQFPKNKTPKEYYEFMRGEITREELFDIYPKQKKAAQKEAWRAELGDGENAESNEEINDRIREALNGEKNWLLIGGPPCQAYSLVGRSRNKGIDPDDPRVYLYRAYYRILAEHNPPMFVMENVKGLLSSKVGKKQIFDQILEDLKDPAEAYKKLLGNKEFECPGYNIYSFVTKPAINGKGELVFNPKDFIIRSEEFGIPQARHRIILLGVRKNLEINEVPILKKKIQRTVWETISGLPKLRSGLSKQKDDPKKWQKLVNNTINNGITKQIKKHRLFENKVAEPKVVYSNPNIVSRGAMYLNIQPTIEFEENWFLDDKINGVCNHETRSHIKADIRRYVYVSLFGQENKRSPKLAEFPKKLLPKHKNVDQAIRKSLFGDRFRVQIADKPATTVTSHISKDGHYYIHYDPYQARSLTVREAARLQTFPDNYFFCGPRTAQYHQVGNAVPPLLANQIAKIIFELLEDK